MKFYIEYILELEQKNSKKKNKNKPTNNNCKIEKNK